LSIISSTRGPEISLPYGTDLGLTHCSFLCCRFCGFISRSAFTANFAKT
jgi:hypothetical protein